MGEGIKKRLGAFARGEKVARLTWKVNIEPAYPIRSPISPIQTQISRVQPTAQVYDLDRLQVGMGVYELLTPLVEGTCPVTAIIYPSSVEGQGVNVSDKSLSISLSLAGDGGIHSRRERGKTYWSLMKQGWLMSKSHLSKTPTA